MTDNNQDSDRHKRLQALIGILLYLTINFVVPYLGAQLINYVWNTIEDTKEQLEQ